MVPPLWVVAGIMIACGASAERVEGEIALSTSQCGLFAVKTAEGFSLLDEHDHHSVFEGDRVRGLLHTPGVQQVEVVGEVTLSVTIERTGLTHEQAVLAFHRRCVNLPTLRHDLN
jgi:hypothetical protein